MPDADDYAALAAQLAHEARIRHWLAAMCGWIGQRLIALGLLISKLAHRAVQAQSNQLEAARTAISDQQYALRQLERLKEEK